MSRCQDASSPVDDLPPVPLNRLERVQWKRYQRNGEVVVWSGRQWHCKHARRRNRCKQCAIDDHPTAPVKRLERVQGKRYRRNEEVESLCGREKNGIARTPEEKRNAGNVEQLILQARQKKSPMQAMWRHKQGKGRR